MQRLSGLSNHDYKTLEDMSFTNPVIAGYLKQVHLGNIGWNDALFQIIVKLNETNKKLEAELRLINENGDVIYEPYPNFLNRRGQTIPDPPKANVTSFDGSSLWGWLDNKLVQWGLLEPKEDNDV